ncbi:MAG TPA: glycosyltransferase family 39 protein [Pirellulales bacterium]
MLSRMRATWRSFLTDAATPDFANRLAGSAPDRARPQRATALLLLVLLAAFVPRAIMAWRVDTVCADGVIYFQLAGELEQGRADPDDVSHLQSGTFPLALATLHRWGLDWESAAKFYGVLAATLAVLPLFGWVRRQFDNRVAVLACLLYDSHPKLIEWSPEAVREPSFWLFFLLSIYFLWRAAVEVDWRLFIAGGAATAITCLTRFEGWFLLAPLCGWAVVRLWYLHTNRLRLVTGWACSLAVIPVVFLAVGQLFPGGNDWNHLRLDPVRRASAWIMSWRAPKNEPGAPVAAPVTAAEITDPHAADWTAAQAAATMLNVCERGFTPLFAILMFGGYFAHLRLFHRSDNLPLLLLVLAVAAAVWIHLWFSHQASSRYVLTIVLISTRSAALGLLDFGRLAESWLSRRWPTVRLTATTALLAAVALVGTVDAVTSDFKSREALADLGKWIHDQYGASSLVVGSESQLALVGFYAEGEAFPFPPQLAGAALASWLDEVDPDVVVISKRRQMPEQYEPILAQRERLGLELIPAERIPCPTKNMLVLARERRTVDLTRRTSSIRIPGP